VQKPISLQRDGHSYGTGFRNVNITVDGKLTCRTPWSVEVRNADTLDIISTVKNTFATEWGEIIQPEEVVVASCCNRNDGSAEFILLDPNTLQMTKSLYRTDIKWSFFSRNFFIRSNSSYFSHRIAQLTGERNSW